MSLLHPAWLLFAVPCAWAWWRTRTGNRANDGLRLLGLAVLLLALAGPYLRTSAKGRDLVVVVDRSLSMPEESQAKALEILRLAEEERRAGDRIAVVSFGREARIERMPSETARFQGFEQALDREGSDLAAALETALELVPRSRQGAILCLSDGESTGGDALAVAGRAFSRGLRIDVRPLVRERGADLSVDSLELPQSVDVGEPFQFNAWVRADAPVETTYVLRRGERVLASGTRRFEPGANRLVFRDVLGEAGIAEYSIELGVQDDRIPANNRGLGAVRAEGASAVLVLNHDGVEDALCSALRGAGIPLVVQSPERARLDHVGLASFRAVVLENVAYERVARGAQALQNFVLDHGGGLMLTGGRASFGVGGYHLSRIDELLPVSMEMRQEHRKLAVAMAIALDRSGSMGVPVAGGTKMDLANLGTSAAIELLSPMDSVAVIAVDSAPHVVQELVPVAKKGDILSRVRRIQAGGGGIFVRTALLAAGRELEGAQQINKHIILFADAADSEEQEQCPELIRELGKSGVTLSVIALGTEQDIHADFLKRCAEQGGGEVYFTEDAADLPRLFAMDTMTAARSTFVDQPTAVRALPGLLGLGSFDPASLPTLGGYNLTYLRPDAQAGMVTQDEYQAPIFAFQHSGLGRSAVYTGEIGGTYGASLATWSEFASFFTTSLRWLFGNEEPEAFFPSIRREGSQAVLAVEIDENAALPPDTAELRAQIETADGARHELLLERKDETYFEARYALDTAGIALATIQLGDQRFVNLPPIALPYSPEYERRPDPESGRRLLTRLARESGGMVDASAASFFRGPRESRAWRLIGRELLLLGLGLLLLEIAARRLSLWFRPRLPAALQRVLSRLHLPRLAPRRRTPAPSAAEAAAQPSASAEPAPLATPAAASNPPPSSTPSTPSPASGLGSALSRARRAADRRLER